MLYWGCKILTDSTRTNFSTFCRGWINSAGALIWYHSSASLLIVVSKAMHYICYPSSPLHHTSECDFNYPNLAISSLSPCTGNRASFLWDPHLSPPYCFGKSQTHAASGSNRLLIFHLYLPSWAIECCLMQLPNVPNQAMPAQKDINSR